MINRRLFMSKSWIGLFTIFIPTVLKTYPSIFEASIISKQSSGILSHVLSHGRGFEKEEIYNWLFGQARRIFPKLMAIRFNKFMSCVAAKFSENLYKIRPCVRNLKYVGCEKYAHNNCDCEPHDFFEISKTYKSIDYTGATYSIEEYEDGEARIGAAYFEVVKD